MYGSLGGLFKRLRDGSGIGTMALRSIRMKDGGSIDNTSRDGRGNKVISAALTSISASLL